LTILTAKSLLIKINKNP